MSDLLNCVSSILHGFRFMIFPETTAAPSLHRPIACATVASQWLSRQHPDHTLTIYGNSLEQNGGFLGLWSFMRLCGHFFESDMISLWLYNYSYVCFPLAFTVHWKYTSYITHNPLRSLSRSHLLQDSCTLTNFLIISNRADTSVARLIDLLVKDSKQVTVMTLTLNRSGKRW